MRAEQLDETLTVRQAYEAMFVFLEEIWRRTRSPELGSMLGDMSLLGDGGTADPAVWVEWQAAVHEAKQGRANIDLRLRKE
ncbi:MAG TPA: hypothetical protein VHZ95_06010 [Polyangiales bacterium]|nr:hypothetical protein [Polyangiales bacterium]